MANSYYLLINIEPGFSLLNIKAFRYYYYPYFTNRDIVIFFHFCEKCHLIYISVPGDLANSNVQAVHRGDCDLRVAKWFVLRYHRWLLTELALPPFVNFS